jgi:anti-anti-sigma regulatory factor
MRRATKPGGLMRGRDGAAVLFDPGHMSLLDARLLSQLSHAGRSLALEGKRLRVVCPDIRHRRLLALTGFNRSFDLIASAREAG